MSQQLVEKLESEVQWRQAFKVLSELRTSLKLDRFLSDRARMLAHGYNLFGLRADTELVCVGSAVTYPHPTHGVDCWVHDLVTLSQARGQGYGEIVMRHIENWAAEQGCSRVLVHTRFERERAQNFYENHLGYERYAVVFQRGLKMDS